MKKAIALILVLVLALTAFTACSKADSKTIKVGASVTPHAEILKIAQEILAEDGYTLEITEFNDYVIPNTATEEGEIDANYFQHQPYLTDFNNQHGTHLVSVAAVHYEPFGIYAGKTAAIADLKEGAQIAVPNDGTNEARALMLLEAEGLIKLKDGASLTATKMDITENPLNLDIVEIEAAQLTLSLQDVDMAVINGNYAVQAGLNAATDALATEDKNSDAAQTYANILVVKEGNEDNEGIQALIKALKSDAVRDFITNTYEGAVVAMF